LEVTKPAFFDFANSIDCGKNAKAFVILMMMD